ncbi:solute carrier family 22 member 3-like [Leptidea sinapis]|uniref:solute carrier family 22 member 3-like n=1 Tax=Leptidea sinapis TaxID=189913 RepID=UPI0021C2D24F|nr:solute carrier family 22 member 3-like [Leptidea sinapis]
MCQEPAAGKFNIDGILSELGSFGKYQLLLLLLLAFRDAFLSMCNFNYVFTASEVSFSCLTDCASNSTWVRFPSVNTSSCTSVGSWADPGQCSTGASDVPCRSIVYDDYDSIVAEFDLGCQPWKRTLVGTIHNSGLVVSFVLYGFISDRYGRKVIIVVTPLLVGAAGLMKSFASDYWTLIALEFLETAFGYGNASMILSLEAVSQKNRVIYSCISDILASIGGAFFGLIAWKVPYWRHLTRAIYAPLLIVVFYIFLVDEGVRWLLAHDRRNEAVRILNKVAKVNNITLSNNAKEMLTRISDEKLDMQDKPAPNAPTLLKVLHSKTIIYRVLLMCACFFCCNFVYSGTVINSVSISGNKYLNYSIVMLVSIVARILNAVTLTRFGRKKPICIAYCLCSLFLMASAFIPKSIWWATLVFYISGKMCSSYGMFAIYVVSMEVFPTTSRNSLTNIANTLGRLGSVLAPQVPLLRSIMPSLPVILFSVTSLGPAGLSLLLPDTSHEDLPDRLDDAEKIDAVEEKPSTDVEADTPKIVEDKQINIIEANNIIHPSIDELETARADDPKCNPEVNLPKIENGTDEFRSDAPSKIFQQRL